MGIAALTFDVFGTLLEVEPGLKCLWFPEYVKRVRAVAEGVEEYRPLDVIFKEIGADLSQLRVRDGVQEALERLGKKFIIASLSNADSCPSLSKEVSDKFGLRWNFSIDISSARSYKPDKKVYERAMAQLNLGDSDVIHVASHPYDLRAAKENGFWTAFIHWPGYTSPPGQTQEFDIEANTLSDLAGVLLI